MEELVVIKHCVKIVCRNPPPSVCPVCGKPIDYSRIPAPAFYECPLVNGHDNTNALSVLVKPTYDTWNIACKTDSDLHIGITDGKGGVVNYAYEGIERENVGWERSLIVFKTTNSDLFQWESSWTKVLDEMAVDVKWYAYNYDEYENNCFDFVLNFLWIVLQKVTDRYGDSESTNSLNFLTRYINRTETRKEFINTFVLSKMEKAIEYDNVINNLKKDGFAIF